MILIDSVIADSYSTIASGITLTLYPSDLAYDHELQRANDNGSNAPDTSTWATIAVYPSNALISSGMQVYDSLPNNGQKYWYRWRDVKDQYTAGAWSTAVSATSRQIDRSRLAPTVTPISAYSAQTTDSAGLNLAAGVTDSRTYSVNNMFATSYQDISDVSDGGGYGKVNATYIDGSNRPTQLYRTTGGNGISADDIGANFAVVSNNLLTNGGGQIGALGVQATGWTKLVGADMVPTTTSFYAGDRAFVIDHLATLATTSHRQQCGLVSGRVYRLRCAIQQAHLVGAGAMAMIRIYGPSDLASEFTVIDLAGTRTTQTDNIGFGIVADGTSGSPFVPVQATFICNATGTWNVEVNLGLMATCTGEAFYDDIVLEEMAATPTVGGYRGSQALDSNNMLVNQRVIPMTNVGGAKAQLFLAGTQTTADNCLTSSGTTITVPALDLYVGDSSVLSYSGQTVTGDLGLGGADARNWVFINDPLYTGTGTFGATTTPTDLVKNPGYIYVGSIIVKSGTGGSGYCVSPDTLIFTADATITTAGELKVGQMIRTRHEATLEWGNYPVSHISYHDADRWLIELSDGRELVASHNHRIWIETLGWTRLHAIRVGDTFEDNVTVVDSHPHDRGSVVKITVEDAHTYVSAGILSHNAKPI